jgi:soluble lytic murein transglycosylase-like protein
MSTLTALFLLYTNQYNLPPHLLSSLCYVESRHNVSAVHHDDGGADSLGVCQIKYETAKDMGFKGTPRQLMKPTVNIKYAAKYLTHQINRYNGRIDKAVIAYNRGHAGGLTTSKYQVKVFKQWRGKCGSR